MIRSFNYTRRKRIRREDIDLAFTGNPGNDPAVIRLVASLASYSLPGEAGVFGEAYTRTEYERFSLGTVDKPVVEPVRLTTLSNPAAASFRLKVVDRTGVHGTILAQADRLTPRLPDEDPERRESLLHVRPADLGEQVWQVALDGDIPVLLINKNFPDWGSEARSPRFLALVYPGVIRLLLSEAMNDDSIDLDDGDNWQARWIQFAQKQLGADPPPSEGSWEEKRLWIEDVAEQFCTRWEACSKYLSLIETEHME